MEDNRSYALSCFRQLLTSLAMCGRYSEVKRTVEYLITNDTLLNSSLPISYNTRMALNFATTACEALIEFDDSREEIDNELQDMALTALDAVDLALKL